MKILLLGRNGQLGWELQRSLAPLGQLLALDARSTTHCGDLHDIGGLGQTLQRYAPDVIVNAAAYTAVDQAEENVASAYRVNAEAVQVLARYAAMQGVLLVHYSTDYVYPGCGTQPWTEGDPVAPLNVYGTSKLAGEDAIRRSGCRHLVLRTSWVYAARGQNFVRTILRLARQRETLSVVDDQFGAPTSAELLADISALAIVAVQRDPNLAGLYNVAAAGETTWFDYARYVLEQAERAGLPLKVNAGSLLAIQSERYSTPALRPRNSRLSTHKLQSAFAVTLPAWQVGVTRVLTEVLEKEHE
ncbi:dTDP-4-dehydrorhamnose reductase [Pseudomonas sichuanensis]|uniref:dTDP-4-dehydrorhamnose reductase n=1 Tax=Pseudomonas TaxID=286 RepID=UPI0036EC9686